ncbi:M28 family peptidase [Ktedonobacter racemifer]|uniref:Peptidase M28 n=1 Tax=Ktedonobacter racemifer DSM 44963 TaxID=485913 RepID=D6TKS6_KTERA|nr:M28 family peptidase [Ktedonobacter racemifer]EFH86376.1 peptidase M28 [Ktedonobacter racemifer DSM 44963]
MSRHSLSLALLLCLCIQLLGSSVVLAGSSAQSHRQAHLVQTASGFPTVEPDYIYTQLTTMATRFQHREAGYDNAQVAGQNGHTGFANYWMQEMTRNLQGYTSLETRDAFSIKGWSGRAATSPAYNIEESIPGALHPEQIVVIGCHYDGEAISTQSAYDDASGCAIELGIARALGQFWRANQVYPARTLRFVLFDAEEQGLDGSFHYANEFANGDMKNIVAMFNEEQNGIAYPLRYLGQLTNPQLPLTIDVSPLQSNALYGHQDALSSEQRQHIQRFRNLLGQALPAVFQQFQAMGYKGLTYHDNSQEVAQPIFTPEQQSLVKIEDDTLGSSDQVPFTLAGLPCATIVGNATYYDNHPPAWSYPYDQRDDTIQLMNTFAQGGSKKSNALTLALALPGMITTWMLHQPDIAGETSKSTLLPGPIADIADIGKTITQQPIGLSAQGYDPTGKNEPVQYAWDFGDGARATGNTVSHAYTHAGTYTLTLSASNALGTRKISKTLTITDKAQTFDSLYAAYQPSGTPRRNPAVQLPTANDALTDSVIHTQVVATNTPRQTETQPIFIYWLIALGILLIVGGLTWWLISRRLLNQKKV